MHNDSCCMSLIPLLLDWMMWTCLQCRDVRTREVGIQEIHHKVRPYQVTSEKERASHHLSVLILEDVCRWSWYGGTTWPPAAGRPSSPTRTPSRTSWSACCACAAAHLSPSVQSWKGACLSCESSTFMGASSLSAVETPASSSTR